MSIYLSHESALQYWLTCSDPIDHGVLDGSRSLARASTNMRDIKRAELPFEYDSSNKLHVLGANHNECRSKLTVTAHRWTGPIAAGSFCEYSELCQISSPEFTFLQMAGCRPLHELIEIGTYLCAGFAVEKGLGFKELRNPPTSPPKLEEFVLGMHGAYGAKQARRALKYIVPNTASPMEVLLCLAFALPPKLGGWGYPNLIANHEIEVPLHLRDALGSRTLRCDLYFPDANGDVEFDGAAYHSAPERLDYTQTRRNVLEAMGVKTVSATKMQVNTYKRFNNFMWLAIERLGLPLRNYSWQQMENQQQLYEKLFGYHGLF